MRLHSESRRALVTNFSNWFIKCHDLKLEDVNTAKLASEFAFDMCIQVELATGILAPEMIEVERCVRDEIDDLQMERWDELGRPL
jgi:hypothetical protein